MQCPSLYQKYKKACGSTELTIREKACKAPNVTFNENNYDELLIYQKGLEHHTNEMKRCVIFREEYMKTCVAEERHDKGHIIALELFNEIFNECNNMVIKYNHIKEDLLETILAKGEYVVPVVEVNKRVISIVPTIITRDEVPAIIHTSKKKTKKMPDDEGLLEKVAIEQREKIMKFKDLIVKTKEENPSLQMYIKFLIVGDTQALFALADEVSFDPEKFKRIIVVKALTMASNKKKVVEQLKLLNPEKFNPPEVAERNIAFFLGNTEGEPNINHYIANYGLMNYSAMILVTQALPAGLMDEIEAIF